MSVVSEQLFYALLIRESFKCQNCSSTEGLHPAHYHEKSRAKGVVASLDDFLLLCNDCHRKYDGTGELTVKLIDGKYFFKEKPKGSRPRRTEA